MPRHTARAATLLKEGRAVMIRPHSFASRIRDRIRAGTRPLEMMNVSDTKRKGDDRSGFRVGCLKAENFASVLRTEDIARIATCVGSFDTLTAKGAVQGISQMQCRVVHPPAKRRAWTQPQHVPAARMEPMHGTQSPTLLPHPGEVASCLVSG